MHELGIMTGVMEAVEKSAVQAGATKVLKVTLSIGEMTEAIEDSLRFAFEVLTEGTMSEGAELEINMVTPRSLCLDCGAEYEHDRFHMVCPECGGYNTKLLAGRELQIDSIEVEPARRLTSVSASLCRRSRGRNAGRRFPIGHSRKATCNSPQPFPIRFITETRCLINRRIQHAKSI